MAAGFRRRGGVGGGQSAAEAELGGYAFYPVGGVEVFDEGDLEAGGGALAGDDG